MIMAMSYAIPINRTAAYYFTLQVEIFKRVYRGQKPMKLVTAKISAITIKIMPTTPVQYIVFL